MFDIGWTELILIAAVTIIVIGPKELPGLLRTVGQMLGRLRKLSNDFKSQIDDAMQADEMQKLRDEIDELKKDNPMADLKGQLEEQFDVDPLKDSEKNKETEDWDNAIQQVNGPSPDEVETAESNVTPMPERPDTDNSSPESIPGEVVSDKASEDALPNSKTREA